MPPTAWLGSAWLGTSRHRGWHRSARLGLVQHGLTWSSAARDVMARMAPTTEAGTAQLSRVQLSSAWVNTAWPGTAWLGELPGSPFSPAWWEGGFPAHCQRQNQCHQRPHPMGHGTASPQGRRSTGVSPRRVVTPGPAYLLGQHRTGSGPRATVIPVPWPAALGFLPVPSGEV